MRIWSISAKYLDTKGLVALWRETLLAKHVLLGNTKGYLNHPQLDRFKKVNEPINAIDAYLQHVYIEALNRGYKFNKDKFREDSYSTKIPVTLGQVAYELDHLKRKLELRDPELLVRLPNTPEDIETNDIFELVPGDVEDWEKIK